MANPFRYVIDNTLYIGFSQPMPLDDGRKVFGITCPDFVDNYFEVIETGNHSSPYLPRTSFYINPFSQKVLEWFSDYKLLFD
jgi:hypothetical protein